MMTIRKTGVMCVVSMASSGSALLMEVADNVQEFPEKRESPVYSEMKSTPDGEGPAVESRDKAAQGSMQIEFFDISQETTPADISASTEAVNIDEQRDGDMMPSSVDPAPHFLSPPPRRGHSTRQQDHREVMTMKHTKNHRSSKMKFLRDFDYWFALTPTEDPLAHFDKVATAYRRLAEPYQKKYGATEISTKVIDKIDLKKYRRKFEKELGPQPVRKTKGIITGDECLQNLVLAIRAMLKEMFDTNPVNTIEVALLIMMDTRDESLDSRNTERLQEVGKKWGLRNLAQRS